MAAIVAEQLRVLHESDIEVVLSLEAEDIPPGRSHVARARIPRPGPRVGCGQVGEECRGRNGVYRKLVAGGRIDAGVVEGFAEYREIGEPGPVRADTVAVEVVSHDDGHRVAGREGRDTAHLPSAQRPAEGA